MNTIIISHQPVSPGFIVLREYHATSGNFTGKLWIGVLKNHQYIDRKNVYTFVDGKVAEETAETEIRKAVP